MAAKTNHFILTLLLILVLCTSLFNVQAVRADGEPPTEPPAATEVVTEPPAPVTEAPVQATSLPVEATAIPVIESAQGSTAEAVPTEVVFSQAPENTEIVVLDTQGQALVLGSQDTANALVTSDPVWCPESVSTPTPGANGCSASFSSIPELLAAMQADPASFSQNGTIFLQKTEGEGFTTPLILDDSSGSLGASFNSLNLYNLMIQGGWDPATGSISDQTSFSGPNGYIQVGSLTNPWIGSLTLRDISVSGASQDGIQLFASEVVLTNVSASYNEQNGISITAQNPGTVTLNYVSASHNGHIDGSGPVGSGVYINGANTLVNILGGSFINDARYGIEAVNSTSSTLPIANLWTDQDDYAPGSVVTISGNDNSLNGNNVGFLFGEAVHVDVQGPNGYVTSCEATADSYGGWSCQITLWANNLAIGDYSYTATGLSSGVSITSAFKDAPKVGTTTVGSQSGSLTAGTAGTVTYTITIARGNGGGAFTAPLTITTIMPDGVTYSFSPSSVSFAQNETSKTATLTITTTAASPASVTTFTVHAEASKNDSANGDGTLTINGAPTSTVTTTATSTVTSTTTSTVTSTATTTATSTATSTTTSTATNTATTTATTTSTSTAPVTATSTAPVTVTSTTTTDTATVPPTNVPTDAVTNTPDTTSAPEPQSLAPKQSSATSSAFVIPLTGGEMIDLDCNSVFWVLGVKLSFLNLCDQQTTIHSVGKSDLPTALPDAFSLVFGLKVEVLSNGQTLKHLPDASGIEMDFPIYNQSREQFAILYWDAEQGKWVEISQQIGRDQISQTLKANGGDELYQVIQTLPQTFYPILTADKAGIFVLVKK